jgi:hypothetical protein
MIDPKDDNDIIISEPITIKEGGGSGKLLCVVLIIIILKFLMGI